MPSTEYANNINTICASLGLDREAFGQRLFPEAVVEALAAQCKVMDTIQDRITALEAQGRVG